LQQFTNGEVTASVNCPDGSVFTMTIPSGSVISPAMPAAVGPAWVEYINSYLQAYILGVIYDMKVCLAPPVINDPTPPGPVPPGGRRRGSGITLAGNIAVICSGETLNPNLCSYTVQGQSGNDFTFSISAGLLPPGTSLVQTGPRSAGITGTPTAPGKYSFTVRAVRVNNSWQSVSVTDTLYVQGISDSNSVLPEGAVGTLYSTQIVPDGGDTPFIFELVGTLPAGLTMNSAGLITGVPTTAGTSLFDVNITDATGNECTGFLELNIISPCTTPGSLAWTITTNPGLGTASGSMSGDNLTGNYDLAITAVGGNSRSSWVGFQTTINNTQDSPCNYSLLGSGVVTATAGGACYGQVYLMPGFAQIGFSSDGPLVFQYDFTVPAFGSVDLDFDIRARAAQPFPSNFANVVGTFQLLLL
jgi:hypothetical protein